MTDIREIDERLAPTNLERIGGWAQRWDVSPLAVIAAIARTGPLLREVAVEVWKGAQDEIHQR